MSGWPLFAAKSLVFPLRLAVTCCSGNNSRLSAVRNADFLPNEPWFARQACGPAELWGGGERALRHQHGAS